MVEITALIPALISFAIAASIGPVLIPFLQRLKLSNTERALGVESHLAKAGTPSMGGIMFLVSITTTSLIFIWKSPNIGPVLFLTLAYGLIGFLDDYLKVVKHDSDGLIAWQKLLLEIVVIVVYVIYLKVFAKVPMGLRIPFTGGMIVDIGWLQYPLVVFAIGGTVNGVNFTDGVDRISVVADVTGLDSEWAVTHFHREGSAGHLDDRCGLPVDGKVLSEPLRVDGRRSDDDLEVGPAGE